MGPHFTFRALSLPVKIAVLRFWLLLDSFASSNFWGIVVVLRGGCWSSVVDVEIFISASDGFMFHFTFQRTPLSVIYGGVVPHNLAVIREK